MDVVVTTSINCDEYVEHLIIQCDSFEPQTNRSFKVNGALFLTQSPIEKIEVNERRIEVGPEWEPT